MSAAPFKNQSPFRAACPPPPKITASKPLPLKICIASPEFIGPTNTDNNSFAYTAMAQALAAAGHQVTCLFLGPKAATPDSWQRWVDKYKADGLTLVALPPINGSELIAPVNLIRSYATYQWLKRNDRFDIIHFPEHRGSGYHTLTAKHHGLAFGKTTICVGLHSMTAWLKGPPASASGDLTEVDTEFMERRVVALADAVVSPSNYLIDWISEQQWEIPRRSASPADASAPLRIPPPIPPLQTIDELVYFGPLDSRKGITLFCDALDCMPSNIASKVKKVIFMGQESIVDGLPSARYVEQRAKNWPFPFELKLGHVSGGPMRYLQEPNRLAVIPALTEVSPYRVLECLVAKVAFVASSVGGVAELIAPADVVKVCFEPNVGALCASLCAVLTTGHRPANHAVDLRAHAEAWLTWHENSMTPADQTSPATQAAIQALSIDPDNMVALKALARIHLNARCHEAAQEACHLILKQVPDDAEALQLSAEARALCSNAEENVFDENHFSRARLMAFAPSATEQLA